MSQRLSRVSGPATLVASIVLFSASATANGLFENRPWQFDTSADKANKAFVLDMIERKKGGFYDAFGPASNTFYNMDCYINASATANENTSTVDATTSSPTTGGTVTGTATANEALNGGGGGPLNNTQENTGNQTTNQDNNDLSVGSVDASGGTNSQILNNSQTNTGDQTAEVNDSTACKFVQGVGQGAGNQ